LELANYVIDNIRDMDEASLKKLIDSQIQHNALPVVNGIMAVCFDISKDERLKTPSVTDKNRLANAAS
jgi:hypothetical protein